MLHAWNTNFMQAYTLSILEILIRWVESALALLNYQDRYKKMIAKQNQSLLKGNFTPNIFFLQTFFCCNNSSIQLNKNWLFVEAKRIKD